MQSITTYTTLIAAAGQYCGVLSSAVPARNVCTRGGADSTPATKQGYRFTIVNKRKRYTPRPLVNGSTSVDLLFEDSEEFRAVQAANSWGRPFTPDEITPNLRAVTGIAKTAAALAMRCYN